MEAGSQPGAVATSRTSAAAVRNARSVKTAAFRTTGAVSVPVSSAPAGSALTVTVPSTGHGGVPSGTEPVTHTGASVWPTTASVTEVSNRRVVRVPAGSSPTAPRTSSIQCGREVGIQLIRFTM